jgi:FAD-linked oxidoreductase
MRHPHRAPGGRRQFLTRLTRLAGGAVAGAALIRPSAAEAAAWRNWSGSQQVQAGAVIYPNNEAELAAAVRQARGPVRLFGGGHSFSPVAVSPGTMICVDQLYGIVRHDAARQQATVRAGTRIAALGEPLKAIGQGLLNEADINMQSVAGAISTATHGTGRGLACYSATVQDMRLVLADGSIVQCSPGRDADLFEAARVSVGSLGAITEVTMQNRAAYRLHETVSVMSIAKALDLVQRERDQHRHIEFFAFPFGDTAIVKRMDITTQAPTPVAKSSDDNDELLEWAADTARRHPWTNAWLQRAVSFLVSDSQRVGDSYNIYPSPRAVAFNEMEYAVPAERGMACFAELRDTIRRAELDVFFPIEFRYVAADECWLSPFYRQPSVTLSVHQYYKQDYRPVFAVAEPILRKHGGRPHWGKLHTLKARDLAALYPRFEDFNRVRRRVDPEGRFLSPYAREILVL